MLEETLASSRILVVDDERPNVLLLETLLRRHGYRNVTGVMDPQAAVAIYEELDPDIIILDLHMPGLDGFGVMSKLNRFIGPDDYVPILVVTADITPEVRLRALSHGAKDFLTKPYDHSETLLRIHNLLEARHLHAQLRRDNEFLEERVRERTRDLEVAIERIRRSERVRDELLSNVSHELRTPLVPILAWADAIGTRADLPPEVIREFAQTIGRNGRRLLQVVEALLRLAEIRNEEIAPRLEVIDMGSLARHAEDVARTYGRDVQVTIGPEATWVTADERYLREILHHVVDNAAKFTPPDSMIEVVANRDDTRIVFAVVDHGPGIPEAERIRAFDDVEQLEGGVTRTQGGIGAGLYIARALVEAHGGTISIRETPGGGATLQFTIPQPTAH